MRTLHSRYAFDDEHVQKLNACRRNILGEKVVDNAFTAFVVNNIQAGKFLKNKEYNKRLYYADQNDVPKSDHNEAMQRAAEELTDVLSDQEDRPLTDGARS